MKKLFVMIALATAIPFAAHADSPQERQRERYADRIENAFERDRILSRFDLDADAKSDRSSYIEIEGRVRNISQRNRAMALARRAAPGYRILNRIQISPRIGRDDDD